MRPRRLDGFSYTGVHRYFVTICTFGRSRLFLSERSVRPVHEQFVRTSEECAFAVIAYCYMPDHLHLLLEGLSERSDLRVFVAVAKQRAAHAARSCVTRRLWQNGYYERVLRDEDDTFNVARYVIQNPVRAGLVLSPGEYPFLGSSILTNEDFIGSCAWSYEGGVAPRKGAPYV